MLRLASAAINGEDDDSHETAAGRLLASLLGGTYILRDVDGAQGMRGLDVVLDGGGYVAVEVTSLMNRPYRAFIGAKITRPAPSLGGTWVVITEPSACLVRQWLRSSPTETGRSRSARPITSGRTCVGGATNEALARPSMSTVPRLNAGTDPQPV